MEKGGTSLLSRNGKNVPVPEWFFLGLPVHLQLDGEICLGRGTSSEQLTPLLKSKNSEEKWNHVGFYIFDLPGSQDPYEERMKQIEREMRPLPKHVRNFVEVPTQLFVLI